MLWMIRSKLYLFSMQVLERPPLEEVVPFYRGYLSTAQGSTLFEALDDATARFNSVVGSISEEQSAYRYAPGKWSVKEVVQHMIDCERIFQYRAMCFARKDATSLPGFDEDHHAANRGADARSIADLRAEHDVLRASTMSLFRSFSSEMLLNTGLANERRFTVRALGWTIAGHALHHIHIIQQRYLDHGQA